MGNECKLDLVSIDGCGVCKKIDWSKVKEKEDPAKKQNLFNRLLIKVGLKKKEITYERNPFLMPWCSLHKKYVEQTYRCLNYDPKKLIKIWGARQDEEVEFDMRMLEKQNG